MAKSKYSPHPMLAREEKQKEKLKAESGKSFDEWVALARKQGPKTQKECTAWLRAKHQLSMMLAWWISSAATGEGEDYGDPETLVAALYSGDKAALRPLHEKVVDAALALGSDVIATSCKTMVPLYRKHVFAELRPAGGGVEVSLALGDSAPSKKFEKVARNAGDRLTYKIVLASPKDLDSDFAKALKIAYEAGAGAVERAKTAKVPPDLARVLKGKAAATWESCTDAMRRDWIVWIDSAKQAETRARRIQQTAEKLAAGKKKMY